MGNPQLPQHSSIFSSVSKSSMHEPVGNCSHWRSRKGSLFSFAALFFRIRWVAMGFNLTAQSSPASDLGVRVQ